MFNRFLAMLTFYCQFKIVVFQIYKGKEYMWLAQNIDCFLYHKISSSDSRKERRKERRREGRGRKGGREEFYCTFKSRESLLSISQNIICKNDVDCLEFKDSVPM